MTLFELMARDQCERSGVCRYTGIMHAGPLTLILFSSHATRSTYALNVRDLSVDNIVKKCRERDALF